MILKRGATRSIIVIVRLSKKIVKSMMANLMTAEVYNTRSLHLWQWGCEYVFCVKSILRLSLRVRVRYYHFNYTTKSAKMQEKIQLRPNPVYENILGTPK